MNASLVRAQHICCPFGRKLRTLRGFKDEFPAVWSVYKFQSGGKKVTEYTNWTLRNELNVSPLNSNFDEGLSDKRALNHSRFCPFLSILPTLPTLSTFVYFCPFCAFINLILLVVADYIVPEELGMDMAVI